MEGRKCAARQGKARQCELCSPSPLSAQCTVTSSREKAEAEAGRGGKDGSIGRSISSLLHTALCSSPRVPAEGPRTSQPCLIPQSVRGSGLALVLWPHL
jgi:hypothetical protein